MLLLPDKNVLPSLVIGVMTVCLYHTAQPRIFTVRLMTSVHAAFTITILIAASVSPLTQAQEICPRGTLDPRYCDRDRNLTADLPLDEDDWIDPLALIFSYTPVEDPAVYEQVWTSFIDHLERVTEKRIIFWVSSINAAPIRAASLMSIALP